MNLSESYKNRIINLAGLKKMNESLLSHGTDEDPIDDYNDAPSEMEIIIGEILDDNTYNTTQSIVSEVTLLRDTKIKPVILYIENKLINNYGYKKGSKETDEIIIAIFDRMGLSSLFGGKNEIYNLIDSI